MPEEQVILDNINLVYLVLKQMNLYKEYEEWFDVGVIGLIKSVKNYNPDYGLALSTYACRCIKNEILLEIRKNNSNKRKVNMNCVSLEKEIYNNGTGEFILLKDKIPSEYDLEKEIIKNDVMLNLLNVLNDKEKYVLVHTYGLFGNEIYKQCKMSKELKKSQTQISRILKKAIEKIKEVQNESN